MQQSQQRRGQTNSSQFQQNNQTYESSYGSSKLKASSRLKFVRKVYSIISVQLACTVLFCFFSMKYQSFARFQLRNDFLYWTSIIGSLITCLVLGFSKEMQRTVPVNYILLTIFTICESYFVSLICSVYPQTIVFQAAFLTVASTLGLTLYAFMCKTDFTMKASILFSLMNYFFWISLTAFFFRSEPANLLLIVIGLGIYTFYLLFDTHLLIGGKRHEISMDDYIMGAMMIYIDIIQIFLKILQLLGKFDKDKKEKK